MGSSINSNGVGVDMLGNEEKIKAAKTGDNIDVCIALQNEYDSSDLRFIDLCHKAY